MNQAIPRSAWQIGRFQHASNESDSSLFFSVLRARSAGVCWCASVQRRGVSWHWRVLPLGVLCLPQHVRLFHHGAAGSTAELMISLCRRRGALASAVFGTILFISLWSAPTDPPPCVSLLHPHSQPHACTCVVFISCNDCSYTRCDCL